MKLEKDITASEMIILKIEESLDFQSEIKPAKIKSSIEKKRKTKKQRKIDEYHFITNDEFISPNKIDILPQTPTPTFSKFNFNVINSEVDNCLHNKIEVDQCTTLNLSEESSNKLKIESHQDSQTSNKENTCQIDLITISDEASEESICDIIKDKEIQLLNSIPQLQKEKYNQDYNYIECCLCNEREKLEDLFTLECNHQIHHKCLKDHALSLMNNSSICMFCPNKQCQKQIKFSILEELFQDDIENLQLFLELKKINLKSQNLCTQKDNFICSINCENKEKCPSCNPANIDEDIYNNRGFKLLNQELQGYKYSIGEKQNYPQKPFDIVLNLKSSKTQQLKNDRDTIRDATKANQ